MCGLCGQIITVTLFITEKANSGMQNAGNLDEYVQVIFDMFNARTADPLSPPVCDRINLFLKRKINKIVKKTKNQAPAL